MADVQKKKEGNTVRKSTQRQTRFDCIEEKCVTQGMMVVLLWQYVYINMFDNICWNTVIVLFYSTLYAGAQLRHNKNKYYR